MSWQNIAHQFNLLRRIRPSYGRAIVQVKNWRFDFSVEEFYAQNLETLETHLFHKITQFDQYKFVIKRLIKDIPEREIYEVVQKIIFQWKEQSAMRVKIFEARKRYAEEYEQFCDKLAASLKNNPTVGITAPIDPDQIK